MPAWNCVIAVVVRTMALEEGLPANTLKKKKSLRSRNEQKPQRCDRWTDRRMHRQMKEQGHSYDPLWMHRQMKEQGYSYDPLWMHRQMKEQGHSYDPLWMHRQMKEQGYSYDPSGCTDKWKNKDILMTPSGCIDRWKNKDILMTPSNSFGWEWYMARYHKSCQDTGTILSKFTYAYFLYLSQIMLSKVLS